MEDVFENALHLLGERLLKRYGFQADIIITKTTPSKAPPQDSASPPSPTGPQTPPR